ncbi:MAG: DNA-3-methyladenine glycosylase 2 family protein [Xanthobacteraceae bacterium]|nr:DNA-3-methyladenine glycosylase 2 family protein [Xanthobacteraceae bacterium]
MTVHLDTQADLDDAMATLVAQDPRLAPILAQTGMPALRRREPGFTGLAAIVCGQQLSTASAAAIWARVSASLDPFHHDAIRKARADRLGRLGLSAAKIKTLKLLAREIADGRLNLDVLAEEDADAAHHTLISHHGIGPWTADIYLLFCLGHGDAWPAGDLAIQEAMRIGLGLKARPSVKEMAPLAEPWRPLRGVAAHLWWAYYRVVKKREGVLSGNGASSAASAVAKPASRKAKTTVNKARAKPRGARP